MEIEKLNIHQKLFEIACEIQGVSKSGRNDFQKYDYFTDSTMLDTIKPLLIKYRILHLKHEDGYDNIIHGKHIITFLKIKHSFINIDNTSDRVELNSYSTGGDTIDKGLYKAKTGARKYIYRDMFNVKIKEKGEDPDPENDKYDSNQDGYGDFMKSISCCKSVGDIDLLLDDLKKSKLPKADKKEIYELWKMKKDFLNKMAK